MKYIVIILISFFIAANSHAKSYSSLGLSTSYLSENNPSYKAKHEIKPTITFSHFIEIEELVIGYSTNRLDNWLTGRKKNNIKFNSGAKGINQQKITYDSFLIGKQFKRFLPMIFIANTKIDNKYYLNNTFLSHKSNNVWLYGVNINYFLNKEISASFSYIFNNEEVYLNNGFVFGINCIF